MKKTAKILELRLAFTGTVLSCSSQVLSGPVVAGVIGNLKMIYDLWGDTCNVASRMQSNALLGIEVDTHCSPFQIPFK